MISFYLKSSVQQLNQVFNRLEDVDYMFSRINIMEHRHLFVFLNYSITPNQFQGISPRWLFFDGFFFFFCAIYQLKLWILPGLVNYTKNHVSWEMLEFCFFCFFSTPNIKRFRRFCVSYIYGVTARFMLSSSHPKQFFYMRIFLKGTDFISGRKRAREHVVLFNLWQ